MDKYKLIPSVGKTFFDEKEAPFKQNTDFLRKPAWMAFGFNKTYVPSFDELYGEKIHNSGSAENGNGSNVSRPVEFQYKSTHPNNKGSVDPSTWKENTPGNNTEDDVTAGNNTKNRNTAGNTNDGLVIESKIKKHIGIIIVALLALILLVLIIKD
jgi:hypothetical protein